MYRYTVFLMSALVGGERSASGPRRFTPYGKIPHVAIGEEVRQAPGPAWMKWRRENSLPGFKL
jgi:hypothetical protein